MVQDDVWFGSGAGIEACAAGRRKRGKTAVYCINGLDKGWILEYRPDMGDSPCRSLILPHAGAA